MTGHQPDASLSDDALRFLAGRTPDEPLDFDRINEVRQQAADGFRPAVDRAIERHGLVWDDVELGGVRCTRLRSSRVEPTATLFYCFGGAFILGDPISEFPVIGALTEFAALEVIAPWYRLAPEHPAPAAADDCFAAWSALAPSLDGPVFVGGESAGGNLALLTAQRSVQAGMRTPDALALLSPAVDLRAEAHLFGPALLADPTLDFDKIEAVERVYVRDLDPVDPAVSPLFGPMAELPPTIITTGTRDLLSAMCLRLDRKLRRAGVDIETRVWDGLWHVFEFYDDYPESAESLAEIADFLNRHRPVR